MGVDVLGVDVLVLILLDMLCESFCLSVFTFCKNQALTFDYSHVYSSRHTIYACS